jgi:hypothetical protein
MAMKKFPLYVRFIEGEEGGGGSEISESPELTYVEPTAQEIADNPAWNDALSVIPEEFHPHLKGEFSKWDKYTQQVQQSFAPFKEFAELGVGSEDIDQALQLAHLFQTNPRGVFDFLTTTYNFTNAEAKQIIQQGQNNSQGQTQSNDEFDLGKDSEFDISKNPQFLQVAQQAQLANQAVQQMQNMQLEQQVDAQVRNEITQIQQAYPNIPYQEIIKRSIANSAVTGRREDLQAAAKELNDMGWFAKKGNPAPPNLSGGGNRALPSSQQNLSTASAKERTAAVAEMLRLANEG